MPQNIELVKATKPVVVSSPPSSKKDAVLVITDIAIKGNDATVSYRYDIEGIRGTAYLKKTSHGWELTQSRIGGALAGAPAPPVSGNARDGRRSEKT